MTTRTNLRAGALLALGLSALAAACGEDAPTGAPALTTPDGGSSAITPSSSATDSGAPATVGATPTPSKGSDGGAGSTAKPPVVTIGGGSDDPRFANAPKLPPCDGAKPTEEIYKHNMKIYGFGLAGDQLYFAGYEEGVYAMPKDGGAPPKLVSMEFSQDLAVAGTSIYSTGAWGGVRLTAEQIAAGTEPPEVSTGSELKRVAERVYSWQEVQVCPNGTTSVSVHDAKGMSRSLTLPCRVQDVTELDGTTYALVADDELGDAIYKLGADGKPVRIVEEDNVGYALGATSKYLYFTKEKSLSEDYLMRAPLEGGKSEVVAGPVTVNTMANDGASFYISDLKNGCLYRYDGDTDSLVAFAKGGVAEDIAFDAQYIYLGNFSGSIRRVAR
jgi:hypothetical protein